MTAGAASATGAAPTIAAIVTAFRRVDQALRTLRTIAACDPPPAEILVHVDGNETACAAAIKAAHPGVRVLESQDRVGPGGGRNRLVAAATRPWVASFDDDSYPVDRDFFSRIEAIVSSAPDASVIGASVYHAHESAPPLAGTARWTADFSGGACVYRREHFIEAGGYVPLEAAYGMEEVDLAIRLHARDRRVLLTSWLRVHHDTDLAHHSDPTITAASIANIALLAFLRYPVVLWPIGMVQCLNRIRWLIGHGRRRGVWRGIRSIPALLRAHRHERRPVRAAAVLSYLRLRRRPIPVGVAAVRAPGVAGL